MQAHRNHSIHLGLPAAAAALCTLALGLTGCSIAPNTSGPVAGASFSGAVHGGQQPISSATVQLYATGNTGYGSAYTYTVGTSLLGTHTVTTAADGTFSITGDYTCPSASTPVYLVATGGNPGLGNGATNPNINIMAALGPCGNLGPSTFVSMNEATTIASVWALSPFMSGVASIGTSSTNAAGLTNAFASVAKLVSIVSGQAVGTNGGTTSPSAKVYMLANILAACVNTAGGTAGDGSACGTLFTNTTVSGGATPTDTITAAMNLAQHPNMGTANLAGLVTPLSPFQPTQYATPSDFSLVVTHTGGGLSRPTGIATDASGNIWIPNGGNNSVSEFSNAGAALSGTTGYTAGSLSSPAAIAVDTSGNAWITNKSSNTVTELAPLGASSTLFTGGNMSAPAGIAIDASGYVWIANSGNASLTQINSFSVLTNYAATSLSSPSAIAITAK
jgi:hypothetical protein